MSREKSNGNHDLKSLVKLVLTRPERHELKDLTESKRAGTLTAEGKDRLRELKDKVAFAALANNAQTVYSYTVEESGRGRARSNPNMRAYDRGRESPGYRPGPSDDANGFYNNDSNEDSDGDVPRKPRPPPKTPRTSFSAADHSRYYSLLNKPVKKDFGHHGVFMGSVTNMVDVPGFPTPFFKIKYEDGDVEDVDYEELLKILVKEKEPAVRKKRRDKKPIEVTVTTEKVTEKAVEKDKVDKVKESTASRAKSPELVSFHKEAPPVTDDAEEARARALTTDAVLQTATPSDVSNKETTETGNREPVRRETSDAVIGRDKLSNHPKWKLASASTLSNKLNSHNQSRTNLPRGSITGSPRANSGIAARWLQAARSDSEAEKMVLTDTDRGMSSADERKAPRPPIVVPKKGESDVNTIVEEKVKPNEPSELEIKAQPESLPNLVAVDDTEVVVKAKSSSSPKPSPKKSSYRERGSDVEPMSPRRSSLKEPNSPKLGPKRKLSWRLNRDEDSTPKEATELLVPKQSPKPRSPKPTRWDMDALKKQVKEAEDQVLQIKASQRNLLLKTALGRLRTYKYTCAFRKWSRFTMASLIQSVEQLKAEQVTSSGDPSEDLQVAREHIQKYESQMAQLREKLAEAESALKQQADERSRRIASLVEERARAVAEEDFEKALALHHKINALNVSSQLADDSVKVTSPVKNGEKESLFAGLATLTLSPVTASTTLRMITTPKRKEEKSSVQVERLGDHGTVIAPADSKLISKPSRSQSVPPKFIAKNASSASWIAKEPKEDTPKDTPTNSKWKVVRSSSIMERAANFVKKPEPEDKKKPVRSSSAKRPMVGDKSKPPLTVRVSSRESDSESGQGGLRRKSSSEEVMKKLQSVVQKDSDNNRRPKAEVSDSDNDELWMKKLSPEKKHMLKGGTDKPPPPPSPGRKPDSPRAPKWSEKTNSNSFKVAEAKQSGKPALNAKLTSPIAGAKRVPSLERAQVKRVPSRNIEGESVKKVPSSQNLFSEPKSDKEIPQAEPKSSESPPKSIGRKSSVSKLFNQVDSSQDASDTSSPKDSGIVTGIVAEAIKAKSNDTSDLKSSESPPKSVGRKSSISKLFNQVDSSQGASDTSSPKDSGIVTGTVAEAIKAKSSDTSGSKPQPTSPLKRGKVFGSPSKSRDTPFSEKSTLPVEESVEMQVKLKPVVSGQSSSKFPAALARKPTVGRDLPEVTPITGSAKTVYAEMTKTTKLRKSKSQRNSMRHHGEWSGVNAGDSCWVSDPHNAYLAATVEEVVSSTKLNVVTQGDRPLHFTVDLEQNEIKVGKRVKAEPPRRLLPREKNEKIDYDDMDELPYLHEASILHNVDVRFRVDKIYTNTGPILIAMNPFKWLPIYDEDVMRQYLNRPRGALPPHCFAEAEASFQALNSSKINQSIIICGDSGAGKTETTKLMLSYLSFVSDSRYHGERPEGTTMAARLVESTPLLEALGNAKTLKNSNSSRFSKFSSLHFNESPIGVGQIEGATLSNLLLESSRVSFQPTGERNYHIFYQLLESSLKFRKQNGLEALNDITAETARYTNHSGCISVPTIDDADDFESTITSMESVQISGNDRTQLLRTLSGVLMLGNIEFEDAKGDAEASVVTAKTRKYLDLAAELLGLVGSAEKLATALVVQIRVLPGGNSIKCGQTAVKSGFLRDALSKAIYFKLFNWVSEAVNKSLRSGKKVKRAIAVLDIFGFEDMSVNSFEQLLINTTNELLQTLFNDTIFKEESEEYIRESIAWDETTFPDNTPTMALLERKPLGLLPYLDSECSRGNAALDGEALARAFNKNHADHPKYVVCGPSTDQRRNDRSRTHDEDFLIKHFAGDVVYSISGFIPKNRDELFAHVQDIMKTSTSSLHLFKTEEDTSRARTVTSKFLNQLSDLRSMLSDSATRFVRCIKSNDNHRPQELNRMSVLRQLVCGGVIAALEVRKAGFPNRMTYREFVREFRVFTPTGKAFKDDEELALNMFLHPRVRDRVTMSAIRPGNSKLFMQSDVLYQLRFLKDYEIYPYVRRIQRWWEAAQGDRTQRLVLRCHKAIHNAMDKASMNGVQFNEDIDHAIEHALELLELAEEVAGVAKVVGKRKLNESNIHTIENVKAAVVELEALVEAAVLEKEEAIKARAEVLANLDSHCNRLGFIFSVAETLLDEHARMTLFKTAKNAELQLHAVRQEYMLAGSEQKHTVSHNFRTSTARAGSRRIKKESAIQMRKLVSRLKSALERKETQEKKASGRMKKKRGGVGSAAEAFGYNKTVDGSVKMDEQQLRRVFEVVDMDKSGEIDAEELSATMQEMSVDVAIADQAAQLVRKVNEDEVITYDQFVKVMTEDSEIGNEFRETFARLKDRIEKIGDWQKQFESVDADMSGDIDPAELSLAMGGMGDDPISEAEARCLIEFANSNNRGTMSMQDFVKMMTQVERFAGGEAARAAHLAKAFELVRHAEDLEHRYSADNLKLVRARDAYRDSIIANEERLLAHDITKFQEVGITAVSVVFLVARRALDIADEALRGVDSDHLLKACDEATRAVDAALQVMEREDRRIALLEKCKSTEEKVSDIRTRATSGATEGLLETSTDLSASLREAESTLAKFNEMRFGRSTGLLGAKDEVIEDKALTMDLDELEEKVEALVKEADECEEFQNKAIAAMKQERLDRLNNIRNKFESGGKQGGQASFREQPKVGGRTRSKTTVT